MIAALIFAAISAQGSARTVDLSRGAPISAEPSSLVCWDTSDDTYIDGTGPDENFGGDTILAGGPGKTILVRFGDLNRVLGPTGHIKKATSYLTLAAGDRPIIKSVGRLNSKWGAGPYFTLGALDQSIPSTLSEKRSRKSPSKPEPAGWSATWRHRLTGEGGASWQQAGANGPEDEEVLVDVHGTAGEKELVIDGLAATIQRFADHPEQNYGLALQFQKRLLRFSSPAVPGSREDLAFELEMEAAPPGPGPDLSVTTISRTNADRLVAFRRRGTHTLQPISRTKRKCQVERVQRDMDHRWPSRGWAGHCGCARTGR